LKSDDDDGTLFDEPTGEMPVVSSTDSRVTITGAEIAADAADETMIIDPTTLLPHWTDAPTGQVPIVVAREAADSDDPGRQSPRRRGVRARPTGSLTRTSSIPPSSPVNSAKTRLGLGVHRDRGAPRRGGRDRSAAPEPDRIQRTRRSISANPLAGRAVRQSNDRNFSRSLMTGVLLAAVVSGVFVLGALPVTVMVLVVLALAGAEAYAGFRSPGRTPPRCSASSRSSRSASPSTTRASPRSGP